MRNNRDEAAGSHIDRARSERRALARRRVRQQRWAAALGTLAVAAALLTGLTGISSPFAGHPVVSTDTENQSEPSHGPEQSFDIVASGDLLIHAPVWQRARALGHGRYDFRPLLARVRPIVSRAALALCHVETPMGAGPPAGFPIFNSPPELATAIKWAGWDACDTASNHSADKGQGGIDATIRALDSAGVRHTGSFRTRAQSHRILILPVKGLRIAVLAYTYGTNGMPIPHPWSVNLISTSKVIADARQARRLGASLVIANFHWGTENVHEPNMQQRDLARYLLRHRIVDVIVGQHVHVVQPIQRIAGRFVVFGEGNLLSNQTANCCPAESQDGLIAIIHVHAVGTKARVTGVDYVPTWVEHPSLVVQPVGLRLRELIRQGAGRGPVAQALRASYRRTVGYAGRTTLIRPLPRRLG